MTTNELWINWPVGDSIHVVPDWERDRHRPHGCDCGVDTDVWRGVLRVTHQQRKPA